MTKLFPPVVTSGMDAWLTYAPPDVTQSRRGWNSQFFPWKRAVEKHLLVNVPPMPGPDAQLKPDTLDPTHGPNWPNPEPKPEPATHATDATPGQPGASTFSSSQSSPNAANVMMLFVSPCWFVTMK